MTPDGWRSAPRPSATAGPAPERDGAAHGGLVDRRFVLCVTGV